MYRSEWSTLRKMMLLKGAIGAPAMEYELTGNPVSFETNVSKPLSGLSIPFTPIQTGSGDPSPDNVRPITGWDGLTVYASGINVFDGEFESGRLDGSGQDRKDNDSVRSKNYIPVVPGESYMVVYTSAGSGSNMRLYYYTKSKAYLSDIWLGPNSITVPDNAYYIRFYMDSSYSAGTDRDIAFNYPSTETSYTPYSGQSYPVVFPALGKNLCPGVEWGSINQTTGEENIPSVGSTTDRTKPIKVVPGETYTISGLDEDGTIRIFTYDIDGVYIGTYTQNITGSYTFTPNSGVYIIRLQTNNSIMSLTAKVQCEKGNQATSYEPYTNTVYGGYVDCITGAVVAEWASTLIKDASNIKYEDTWGGRFYLSINGIKNIGASFSAAIYCPIYKSINANVTTSDSAIIQYSSFVYIKDSRYTDAQDFKAAVGDYPVVYQLATPVVVSTIDPISLQTLIGDNTVWSDTNGENTIKYLKKG